ncbi:MAG: uncharacterized protein KVP18_001888, partial [Porospora cf. gigantea A]|uniref:uncharacterized protein n=1 Tax=Porospora cf. gigantea A TaxID=2853593 RepID=UPI003559B099
PEVLFGNYDKRCDIWSTGVILYILLCGYPPFYGQDNKEILRKVKIGEFSFDPRHWKRVSEHAKDLVRRLLTYDPRRRPSAADSIQHPWIQYYAQSAAVQENPLNYRLGVDLLEKFKAFRKCPTMKRLAITCVAYQMSEKEIGSLHDIFLALDANHDGVLTVSEIKQAFQSLNVNYDGEVMELLEELDTDGNGTIDYTEFIAASIDHKLYEQERVLRQAFRVFDLDNDGKITPTELQRVLEMNFLDEDFDQDMVQAIIREVDLNEDGVLDFTEFHRMMKAGSSRKKDSIPSAFNKAKSIFSRKNGE